MGFWDEGFVGELRSNYKDARNELAWKQLQTRENIGGAIGKSLGGTGPEHLVTAPAKAGWKGVKAVASGAKNTVMAGTNAVGKTFRTVGWIAAALAGTGALAYIASSASAAKKFKPGDEAAPLPEPDMAMMSPQDFQASMQPQGRMVLGPHTAKVLGQEAGGMVQPSAPNVDGKSIADLGSMPPTMAV